MCTCRKPSLYDWKKNVNVLKEIQITVRIMAANCSIVFQGKGRVADVYIGHQENREVL